MKPKALYALAIVAALFPTASLSQRRANKPSAIRAEAAVKAEPAICAKLMADYEGASKKLAYSQSEDAIDDSAPRTTMREMQNSNVMNQAQMTMDLMKSAGCTMPTFVPSASRYGLASLRCATALQGIKTKHAVDRVEGKYVSYPEPVECDTATWKPDTR
ncbi:hypothetical protein [Sphingomonas sp. PB1R3]|uniref:hypothetical protein n=1 Tax=Sphingomonas flavida TaxID=3096154 RepID=UPI002FCB9FBD